MAVVNVIVAASPKAVAVRRPKQVLVQRVVPLVVNPDPTVALALSVDQGRTVDRARSVAPSLKVVLAMTEALAPSVVRVQKVVGELTMVPGLKGALAMTADPVVSEVVVVVAEAQSQAVMHLQAPPRRREPVVRPLVRCGPLVYGLRR